MRIRIADVGAMTLALCACGARGSLDLGSDYAATMLEHAALDRSDLVIDDEGRRSCVPRDPGADDWYGCWAEDGGDGGLECITPPERMRVADDGAVVLQLQPTCAAGPFGLWDVRLDGQTVPTNRIVWTNELRLPPDLVGAGMLDIAAATGLQTLWRSWNTVQLEEEACGHEVVVEHGHDGPGSWSYCRTEWDTFAAKAGGSGELVSGRVDVRVLEPQADGRVSLDLGFAACGAGQSSLIASDGEAIPVTCCTQMQDATLEWDVGEGGRLLAVPYYHFTAGLWGGSYCCQPAESSWDRHCADSALHEFELSEKE